LRFDAFRYDGSTKAKVMGKELCRRYFDYFGIISTEYNGRPIYGVNIILPINVQIHFRRNSLLAVLPPIYANMSGF
jgi:hypothetical protein